jgi:hypothetical protein
VHKLPYFPLVSMRCDREAWSYCLDGPCREREDGGNDFGMSLISAMPLMLISIMVRGGANVEHRQGTEDLIVLSTIALDILRTTDTTKRVT